MRHDHWSVFLLLLLGRGSLLAPPKSLPIRFRKAQFARKCVKPTQLFGKFNAIPTIKEHLLHRKAEHPFIAAGWGEAVRHGGVILGLCNLPFFLRNFHGRRRGLGIRGRHLSRGQFNCQIGFILSYVYLFWLITCKSRFITTIFYVVKNWFI